MPQSDVVPHRPSRLAQAGAAAYVIWSLLHFRAAWTVCLLGQTLPAGMAHGRLVQAAWNLMWFSIIALVTAVVLNWRNDVRGWWINLVAVSVVDLGFIFFVLLPGYVPIWPGLSGPLFWVLGLALSTLALRRAPAG